jgi:hypothetical protein
MEKLNKQIQNQFDIMCQTGKLFRVEMSGQQVWDLYLSSFKKEDDPVFRDPESSVHNCNHCKNFIRRYGNVVAIDENHNIITMFNVECEEEYQDSMNALSKAITNSKVKEVFFETFNELNSLPYESCIKTANVFRLGIDKNHKRYTKEEAEKFGVVKANEIKTFNHFHLNLPKQFVDQTGKSVEAIMGNFRDDKNVFQRAMEEISLDTLYLVKDLINQGSLLDGSTHLHKVETIAGLKKMYDRIPKEQLDNWCWLVSYKFPLAKFRNELIGVLCTELAEGKEINDACKAWNYRVDPQNYMKAVAPITKKQIEEAKKFVEENGYEESFDRRFATIDDIKASEILHSNIGKDKIKTVSMFDAVKSTSTRHKRAEFEGIEEVTIDKFMKDILPGCTSVEAFLQNSHEGNMVSLTTANVKESKPIFKWDNNYSWTFNGNLAGKSQIKENVKAVGGKITGILRCSLQWNDEDTKGIIDFDLHCKTPSKEIYYGDEKDTKSGGWLDVDMINPTTVGIENITWQNKLPDGIYKFFVKNFSGHTNHKGFKAEIEFDGNVFTYHCTEIFKGNKEIATITVKNGVMDISHALSESSSSKEIYGLETNQFHKVNLVCLSPNHWGENNVGNKHYFFMLDKCKSLTAIRSFHSENLIPELANHRKVLEVLGNTTMIEPSDKQLSGLGFNSSVKDEVILKLSGSHKRVVKVLFNGLDTNKIIKKNKNISKHLTYI